jgi:hypothetical protein
VDRAPPALGDGGPAPLAAAPELVGLHGDVDAARAALPAARPQPHLAALAARRLG